jgi:murein tripeptide amidase MpaA
LLEKYNFYIVPMVNQDGVFLGNHRTGVLGQDLNRKFNINFSSSEMDCFPEIEAVQKYAA